MDCVTFIANALSAGFGACAGAMVAYVFADNSDKKRKREKYLTLLLYIHENLAVLYEFFLNIPENQIKEIDGQKVVAFDIPLPELSITPEQMTDIFEVSHDKDMPASLTHLQQFLKSNSRRTSSDGFSILTVDYIQQCLSQLKGMLISVRVQYRQETNDDIPLADVTNTPLQMH